MVTTKYHWWELKPLDRVPMVLMLAVIMFPVVIWKWKWRGWLSFVYWACVSLFIEEIGETFERATEVIVPLSSSGIGKNEK